MPDTLTSPPLTGVTVRRLPPEEWTAKLSSLPFAANGLPDPAASIVLVAENPEGEIVGLWSVGMVPMLDGLWSREDYRKHSWVAAKLLKGMKETLTALGLPGAFTLVQTPEVLILALKAGFEKVPGDVLVFKLEK